MAEKRTSKVKYQKPIESSSPDGLSGELSGKLYKFTSKARDLSYIVYELADEKHPLTGEDIHIERPIQFRNHVFTTTNEIIATRLMMMPNYGGSSEKNYEDGAVGREHLFYLGDFPDWYKKKLNDDKNYITLIEGQNDVTGDPLN